MKSQPSGPGATSTPTINPTLTAEALQTAGPAAQQTATAETAATAVYANFYATQTASEQIAETVIALQTDGPTAQATATAQAALTIVMEHFQATQTAIIAVTQTVVVATQTAVAVATQTRVALVATQTAVVVAMQTAIAAIPYTDLASVPAGTYTQTDGASSFSHTISAFKMGKYQVTYDLWYTVYQWAVVSGYTFQNSGTEGSTGTGGAAPTTANQPALTVTWRDAIVWCNAYSQEAGLTPCYTYSSAVIKDSTNATACDNAVCVWANNGYRLPTEGEYQYAASYINGSSWTPYNYASGATADYTNAEATGLVAWYNANCSRTQAVGGLAANALGIYDMSGNVYEWCWDWYGAYPGTSTDYRGPGSGSARVLRGGYYYNSGDYMQVGYRNSSSPDYPHFYLGFRFARTN
jgi:formylglycine-generating enzyme required for sulfatase activity